MKDDLGFVAPANVGAGTKEEDDVFAKLLERVEDDERAVEPTDEDLGTLEEEWQRVAALKEAADDAAKRADAAKKAYNAQKARMIDAMKCQGTRQFRGASGGSCTIAEMYATTVEDEEAFMAWVQESHPELLSVHSQRRTKFVREEYRDKGVPPDDPSFPPGLKSSTVELLQVRGARPK